MSKSIEATYDGHVFRPDQPLDLRANTRVRLVVEAVPVGASDASFLQTARATELSGPADWSANVEAYLYGPETSAEE